MSQKYCWVGSAAPSALTVNIKPNPETLPDLSVVSGASFVVTLRDGSVRNWDAVISDQSSDALRLRHVFASDGSDCDRAGVYRVLTLLTTPDGQVRCTPFNMQVKAL